MGKHENERLVRLHANSEQNLANCQHSDLIHSINVVGPFHSVPRSRKKMKSLRVAGMLIPTLEVTVSLIHFIATGARNRMKRVN